MIADNNREFTDYSKGKPLKEEIQTQLHTTFVYLPKNIYFNKFSEILFSPLGMSKTSG